MHTYVYKFICIYIAQTRPWMADYRGTSVEENAQLPMTPLRP